MKVYGNDLMLFVGGKSVAYAKNHTLDLTMSPVDTSNKDEGFGRWQDNDAGVRSWTMGTENLVGDGSDAGASIDDLMQAFLNGDKVDVIFTLQSDIKDLVSKNDSEFKVPQEGWTPDKTNYYKGKALITALNISAPSGDFASGTATFTGCGNLQRIGKGLAASARTVSAQAATPVMETAAVKK